MSFKDYQAAYAALNALRASLYPKQKELNDSYTAVLTADFKKAFPKRKYTAERFGECPNGEAIHKTFKAEADQWYENEYKPVLEELETRLASLAEVCMPDHTSDLQQVDFIYSGAYRSQGFSQGKYTRNAAENKADIARYHGFKVEIRPVGQSFTDSHGIVDQNLGIFVDCDDAGWDLLKRKPGIELREWVRLCWKRGVNPRVYNPFLPYNLEEQLGLDYFGNDVASPKAATPEVAIAA